MKKDNEIFLGFLSRGFPSVLWEGTWEKAKGGYIWKSDQGVTLITPTHQAREAGGVRELALLFKERGREPLILYWRRLLE